MAAKQRRVAAVVSALSRVDPQRLYKIIVCTLRDALTRPRGTHVPVVAPSPSRQSSPRWRATASLGRDRIAISLRRYCRLLVTGILAIELVAPTLAAEPPPLQMGVLPYLSNERLFAHFLPMKEYLEAQLKRRIVMSTTSDFKTYVQRAARGDYDIYQTAPHFALLAEAEQGYRRVSRLTRELDGDVIVRRDSPMQHVEDLRGRIVITPDALAITSMLGEQLLKDHGLSPGRDYRLLRAASHNNAILTVHRGAADAAITSAAEFEQLLPEVKRDLRVLTKTRKVPHMMVMAHSRLSTVEYERLKRSLLAFTHDGPGRKFFDVTGYGDMGPITDADMARLRPFLTDLKDRLK